MHRSNPDPVPPSPANVTSPARADQTARHPELEVALAAAIKRSLDEAFQRASLPVSPPKGQLIAEQVTHEVTVAIEETMSGAYQGPMPPPAMMQAFDAVVPGLAREIADAANEERRHRHRWENKALWSDIFVESGGLFMGWALAAACAVAAALLARNGNNLGAAIMLSVPAAAMVRTIVSGSRHPQPDRTERNDGGSRPTNPMPRSSLRNDGEGGQSRESEPDLDRQS
jgi:hypothetical protein